MDEPVWIYFGVLVSIISIGIVATLLIQFQSSSEGDRFFQGLEQLNNQANLVCSYPRETQLSVTFDVPVGALLFAQDELLCGFLDAREECYRTNCGLVERTIINLTDNSFSELFSLREYTCTAHKGELVNISC